MSFPEGIAEGVSITLADTKDAMCFGTSSFDVHVRASGYGNKRVGSFECTTLIYEKSIW